MLFVYKDRPADEEDRISQIAQAASEKPKDGTEGLAHDTRGKAASILKSVDTLSEAETERLKGQFRDIFEKWYRGEEAIASPDHPFAGKEVSRFIAEEAGEGESYADHYLTPRYREAAHLFLAELIKFVKVKSSSDHDKNDLSGFIGMLQELMFSYSPNITNEIGFNNLFILTALTTRVPETRGWLGATAVGELVYEMSFARAGGMELLVKQCENLSVPEVLDVIHMCQTLGADAIANGEWAYQGLRNVRGLVQQISDFHSTPFVQYAAKLCLERLEQEQENPSLSVVKYSNDPGEARLRDRFDEDDRVESRLLRRQIKPDSNIPHKRMLRISEDYVATFDHSASPQFIGKCDLVTLSKAQIADEPLDVDDAYGALNERIHPQTLFNILQYLNENKVIAEWQRVCPAIPNEAWTDFFETCTQANEVEKNLNLAESSIVSETEDRCLSISMRFLDLFTEKISDLHEEIENEAIRADIETFQVVDDTEQAFMMAERICRYLGHLPEAGKPVSQSLFMAYRNVLESHQAVWNDASKMRRELHENAAEKLRSADSVINHFVIDMPTDIKADLISGLKEKLGEIKMAQEANLKTIHFDPLDEVSGNPELNPFPTERDKELPILLQQLHRPAMRKYIEQDLGIDFKEIPLASQIHLLRFMQDKEAETFERFKAVLEKHPRAKKQIAGSFLACAQNKEYGDTILALAENMKDSAARSLFRRYEKLVSKAQKSADKLQQAFTEGQQEGSPISKQELVLGMLSRGNDLLREAGRVFESTKDPAKRKKALARCIEGIKAEDALQSASRGFFNNLSDSLNKPGVNLKDYARTQEFIVENFESHDLGKVLLGALQAKGALAPVPEIHWRVDRSAEEYDMRFGFKVKDFLKHFEEQGKNKVILEMGPGNGSFKKDRGTALKGYTDLAVCDKLYYPVNTLVHNILDFKKIERHVGPLSDDEKKLLSDFLYRLLVIKEGQHELDKFEYDQEVMDDLKTDANSLKDHLKRKAHLLKEADKVPTTISNRDENGDTIYPFKLKKPNTEAFNKACELISDHLEDCVIDDFEEADIYSYIPAYSPGTIISDFTKVKNIAKNQVDVTLGSRSSVFLQGETYEKYMQDLANSLTESGIIIDDSVRDLDGHSYRLAELLKVQKEVGYPFYVVTGPGFENEDYNQDEPVPRSIIITQDQSKIDYLKANLTPGFELHRLDEIAGDADYVSRLDAEGKVLKRLKPEREHLGLAA